MVLSSAVTEHFHQDPVHQLIQGDPFPSFLWRPESSGLLVGHLLNESKSQHTLRQGQPRKAAPIWRLCSLCSHEEPSSSVRVCCVCVYTPAVVILSLDFWKALGLEKNFCSPFEMEKDKMFQVTKTISLSILRWID